MSNNNVQLWQGRVLTEESPYDDNWRLLDDAEKNRAMRIQHETKHKEYVHIHAQVRCLLAKLLNQNPEAIIINRSPQGKPYLAEYTHISFNLSHSHEYYLLAISENCNLGVDIEFCKLKHNISGLVDKCFAANERDYWYLLSEYEQHRFFYECWTRKEAFVKAIGRGIALGLDQVILDIDNMESLLSIPKQCGYASDWFVHTVKAPNYYCAALVLDKPSADIRLSYVCNVF